MWTIFRSTLDDHQSNIWQVAWPWGPALSSSSIGNQFFWCGSEWSNPFRNPMISLKKHGKCLVQTDIFMNHSSHSSIFWGAWITNRTLSWLPKIRWDQSMTCSAVLVGEHSGHISRVIRSVKYAECFSHICGKPKAERTRGPGLPEYYSTWWGVPAPNLHVACWPFTCGVSLDVYRLSSEAQASEFYWLVVWNIFYFPYITTDFHIFQRGRYTTNQSRFLLNFSSFTLQATSHESSPL